MKSLKKIIPVAVAAAVLAGSLPVFAAPAAGEPAAVTTQADAAQAAPAQTDAAAGKAAEAKPAASSGNPLVQYDSVLQANNALGYRPLVVPRIYGYECYTIYVISNRLAQLTFKSNIDDSTLIVRTAVIQSVGTDEISGYHGINWTERPISRSHTLYGIAPNGNQVVSWVEGRYAFSVIASKLDEQTFMRQMKGLVRTSEQRYNRRKPQQQ